MYSFAARLLGKSSAIAVSVSPMQRATYQEAFASRSARYLTGSCPSLAATTFGSCLSTVSPFPSSNCL